jgi:hypothetical protein
MGKAERSKAKGKVSRVRLNRDVGQLSSGKNKVLNNKIIIVWYYFV